jgi:glycosyltransferase involved in cell wall biosynthesis
MFLSLRSDAMLILGVSGSLFLPIIRLLYRGKIITNIDGIEWKRNKWNKLAQFILHVSEKAAVRYSDIVIGDNQGIVEYVVKAYKKNAVLIEYGADHIKYFPNDVMKETLYAISVCRIEPENNIHLILEAFSCGTDLSLMVVGNWKNSEYGIRLLYKYKDITRFHLLDPIYDLEKINILRSNAFLYVHGHSAGGTNPSLVEAMFLGLPIFAFDCIYNRFTTEDQCVYWSNADELHSCIINQGNSNLNSIGKKMKLIAERKYCWNAIVSKYENLFLNVLRRNLPPG